MPEPTTPPEPMGEPCHIDICPECGAPPFNHGLDPVWCCTHEYERRVPVRYVDEAEVARLRELAATATRAHTRAVHALAGNLDYPENERRAMGAYLTQELQADA